MSGRQIMTAEEIRRATTRISHEIVEKQAGTAGLVLVGIQRRGVPLARLSFPYLAPPNPNPPVPDPGIPTTAATREHDEGC